MMLTLMAPCWVKSLCQIYDNITSLVSMEFPAHHWAGYNGPWIEKLSCECVARVERDDLCFFFVNISCIFNLGWRCFKQRNPPPPHHHNISEPWESWHPGFPSHVQSAQELLDQELYFKVVSTRRRHQVARCLWSETLRQSWSPFSEKSDFFLVSEHHETVGGFHKFGYPSHPFIDGISLRKAIHCWVPPC